MHITRLPSGFSRTTSSFFQPCRTADGVFSKRTAVAQVNVPKAALRRPKIDGHFRHAHRKFQSLLGLAVKSTVEQLVGLISWSVHHAASWTEARIASYFFLAKILKKKQKISRKIVRLRQLYACCTAEENRPTLVINHGKRRAVSDSLFPNNSRQMVPVCAHSILHS